MDQEFIADGRDMKVTLDGSGSSDPDGRILKFIWLSADTEAVDGGGIQRSGPDPEDVVDPTVTLGEGEWTFTLWVRDDEGRVSAPDNVVITIGEPPPSPDVVMCAESSLESVSLDCRLCTCAVDEGCLTATPACTQGCWDMAICTADNCAGLGEAETADCARTMCADYIDDAVTGGILEFGPCAQRCPDECNSAAQGGGEPSPPAGPVAMCADAVVQTVSAACRTCVCDIDDTCRDAATACNQACWDLYFCGEAMCGDLPEAEKANCARTMCDEFIDAGGIGALGLGPCADQCPDECVPPSQ